MPMLLFVKLCQILPVAANSSNKRSQNMANLPEQSSTLNLALFLNVSLRLLQATSYKQK